MTKTYSKDEVFKSTLEYFKGDELATNVWINKYNLKDSQGNLYELNPDDMHHRLADEFTRIEAKYPNPMSQDEIFNLLRDFKYIIPGGSPMSGIGNNFQIVSLSNCYVVNNQYDSYGSIIRTDEEIVQLCKRRGGVGTDLSHIRPKGSPVKNSALTSTGVVPFMERYSNSIREVAQNGRRGALMLSESIKSMDAEEFIDAKMEQGKVTGANISVKIDDEFVNCVLKNKKYTQQYPIDSVKPQMKKDIDAKKLWDKIIHNAWKSAEPGVLFWDSIIKESLPDCYANDGFATVSTNPCGEIPSRDADSCRLMAINLYSYVDEPFTENSSFNESLFISHVQKAQRIMDDLLDLELEKLQKIIEKIESDPEPIEIKQDELNLWLRIYNKATQGRRTGLGVTAEGDMLAALGYCYGTKEATEFSTKIHQILAVNAYKSSAIMAGERGTFEIYDREKEINNPFLNRLFKHDKELEALTLQNGRRNIAQLTIAPTGSLSLLTQTTSGY